MASKGLMIAGGLGQGLLQGLQSYNDTKRMRMEEERMANAQRASDLGLLFKSKESGYDMTPDGGLIESDYLKKKRAAELGLIEAQIKKEKSLAEKNSGLIGNAVRKNNEFDALPKDEQEYVKKVTGDVATKSATLSLLEAAMKDWDDLPDEQKIQTGSELMKAINMQTGASDAVGREEVGRIGAALEWAPGLNSRLQPQAGRDLPGFKEGVLNTIKRMKRSMRAGEQDVANRFGKYGIQRTVETPDPDIEVINTPDGRKFKKVPGGWEEIP